MMPSFHELRKLFPVMLIMNPPFLKVMAGNFVDKRKKKTITLQRLLYIADFQNKFILSGGCSSINKNFLSFVKERRGHHSWCNKNGNNSHSQNGNVTSFTRFERMPNKSVSYCSIHTHKKKRKKGGSWWGYRSYLLIMMMMMMIPQNVLLWLIVLFFLIDS